MFICSYKSEKDVLVNPVEQTKCNDITVACNMLYRLNATHWCRSC